MNSKKVKNIISLIAAIDKNFGIGINNSMPWHLPDDFKYFKQQTLGKPVVMGRKTFESIGSKPLVGRDNYILTRQDVYIENVVSVSSINALLTKFQNVEIMIIGGEQIYRQFYPIADKLYLTMVEADIEADSFFPIVDYRDWNEIDRIHHPKDERHCFAFDFVVLQK